MLYRHVICEHINYAKSGWESLIVYIMNIDKIEWFNLLPEQ